MATRNGIWVGTTTINGTNNSDLINGDADSERIFGGVGWDTIDGGDGNDSLDGGADMDSLDGGKGNDTLVGGGLTGDDTLSGGTGNDIFVIQRDISSGQTIHINDFTIGQDKLDLTAVGISDIETLNYVRVDIESNELIYEIYTNGSFQTITLKNQWMDSLTTNDVVLSTANSAGTLISATSKSDLFGGAGNDTLMGSAFDDQLFGEADNDRLEGGKGNDTLVGGTGNDIILGGEGFDWLIGGAGNDTLDGGLDGASPAEELTGGDGSDVFVLQSQLQNTGYAIDKITDFNTVEGDKLDLRALGIGDLDTLKALTDGSSTIVIYKEGGNMKIDLNGVAASSLGASNVILNAVATNNALSAANRSDLFGAGGNDTLTGSSHEDRLFGEVGNDSLNGNGSNDILNGGAGDDTLNGGQGEDTVLGGAGNDRFVIKDGGYGDLMIGGTGIDTVDYSTISNSIKIDLRIITGQSVFIGVDSIREIENVVGGTDADRLSGNAGANVLDGKNGADILYGYTGNDTLIGGLGNDSLNGGDGFDYASFESAGAGVTIDLRSSILTHAGTITAVGTDFLINIEGLIGSKNYVDTLIGNASANALNGSNESLADALYGQGGNDTYYVGNGDKVYETTTATSGIDAGGVDTVVCSYTTGTYTLGNFVENLTLSGTAALNGNGNSLANKITGNAANNILNGGSGNDSLSGGAGNDTLIGGTGKDSLTGGASNDIFDFNALSEMGTVSTTWDVITDFVRGQDKIDLSTLDANTATTTNEAFNGTLLASATSFSAAGQLKLVSGVLYGNTDTDSTAEFAIQLTGISALNSADFVL